MKKRKDKKGVEAKGDYTRQLYKTLFQKPMSRRMAVTELGKPDQTYTITNQVNEWLKNGRAQIIKIAKCERSGRFVEFITTNPELFVFPKTNQFDLFE